MKNEGLDMKKYDNDLDNSYRRLERATTVFIVTLAVGMGGTVALLTWGVIEFVKEMSK